MTRCSRSNWTPKSQPIHRSAPRTSAPAPRTSRAPTTGRNDRQHSATSRRSQATHPGSGAPASSHETGPRLAPRQARPIGDVGSDHPRERLIPTSTDIGSRGFSWRSLRDSRRRTEGWSPWLHRFLSAPTSTPPRYAGRRAALQTPIRRAVFCRWPRSTTARRGPRRRALAARVEAGPVPLVDGVVRWRLVDLARWVWEEFRVSISPQTLSRELRAMGYRKLSARPRHQAQDPNGLEAYKKVPRRAGGYRQGTGPRQAYRGLVPGRDAHRPEEQDHPPLGAPRQPAGGTERPAHRLGLHFRRHLSQGGQGRRPRHAPLRNRGHEPAPD